MTTTDEDRSGFPWSAYVMTSSRFISLHEESLCEILCFLCVFCVIFSRHREHQESQRARRKTSSA